MAVHLRDHLAAGHHGPGMFVVHPTMTLGATIKNLSHPTPVIGNRP
jgi:hypothetical protein